ncbi:hypothetical protein EV128_10186 [Rhizobium azibense]|nr:hypothetical protein EV128_10186 [Rhizobium azibense]
MAAALRQRTNAHRKAFVSTRCAQYRASCSPLEEVAVRVLGVDGRDFTHRSGPLARPVDNFHALALDLQDDRVQRGIG